MSNFPASEFQTAIFNTIRSPKRENIIIKARAGSGKTTTIVKSLQLIPETELTIFLAFNKSIVRELEARVPSHVKVATLHSWGMKELVYRFGKNIKIDDSKISKIIKSIVNEWNIEEDELEGYCNRVEKIVDMMRFSLPQSREELLENCEKHEIEIFGNEVDHAKQVLLISRKDTSTFDFTDMIYFPAFNPTMRLRKFKNVFVDECQDLNRAQQEMLKKLIDPNEGRLIAVGDPNQSIYGFAGADISSFNNLRNMLPNTVELPLSFSYRCGSKIIEHAQEIVSDILPSPNAQEGNVKVGSLSEITDGDFVLCRNTRPLVSLCMRFISQGKKATIKGGDIGKNLISMIKKTKVKTQEPMFKKLEANYAKLLEKTKEQHPFKDAEKIPMMVNLSDKIEAIRAISNETKTNNVSEIVEVIESIFSDETYGIVLSTMHKSKGLEADNVFIIEAQLCPAFYAMQPWQKEQEFNLIYVARTRAKKNLVYINDWISDETKMPYLKKALNDLNLN